MAVKELLPVSFKDFVKEPVKGMLFLVIIAIGYLYIDGKVNYTSQIENQGVKIEKLELKVKTQGKTKTASKSNIINKIATK